MTHPFFGLSHCSNLLPLCQAHLSSLLPGLSPLLSPSGFAVQRRPRGAVVQRTHLAGFVAENWSFGSPAVFEYITRRVKGSFAFSLVNGDSDARRMHEATIGRQPSRIMVFFKGSQGKFAESGTARFMAPLRPPILRCDEILSFGGAEVPSAAAHGCNFVAGKPAICFSCSFFFFPVVIRRSPLRVKKGQPLTAFDATGAVVFQGNKCKKCIILLYNLKTN